MENDILSNTSPFSSHIAWGIALAIMGIAVFFRVPQVVPELAQKFNLAAGQGFISFCLYIVGVILLGGGIRKIFLHFNPVDDDTPGPDSD